ncbi:peptidylprolyl isomerase [Aliiroseovarius sp.]|uniref:peptidylprolyl isomerase n=1 Tax=Aliiroseovarius sp. TaxID=1872442 RepID=UPI002627A7B2|nr:peptidylprolyl isomerase [Aliiroseovarius sp.]
MSKRHSFLIGAAMAVALALPTAAEEVTADTIVATVNGETLTLGHLVAARSALPQQYLQLPDDVLFEGLLEQMIQQIVLTQAVGELDRRVLATLENERRALIAGVMLQGVIEEAITEEALQEAYDAQFANAEPTEEWNASHILVSSQDEADALIEELSGGADFAALAKEHSTGPSGPSGGELGWFSSGMMVPAFEAAVMEMEVGAVSEPVATQFGWHVVKLNDKRLQGPPPLEEVRDQLAEAIQGTAMEEAIAALMATATIDRPDLSAIDPATLKDETLID